MNNKIKYYILFNLAIAVTFTFLVMLQLFRPPLFFVFLLLMHGGIVLFIVSKKKFKKAGVNCGKYYLFEYILFALYVPVLVYKLGSYTGLYEVNNEVKLIVVIILTVISIAASVFNSVRFYSVIKQY